jgi:hypothetical protein
MNQKIIGTVRLDGLIEGPLPNHPDGAEQLRQWTSFAQAAGLKFALEIDGSSFSLLAGNAPLPAASLGPDVSATITAALAQLLKLYRGDDVRRVMSTLRSVEYAKGEEIQTLYVVGPGGKAEAKSRTVSAATVAPEAPLSWKDKLKLGAIGVLAALAVFGVSALFIDYRAMFGQVKSSFSPPSAEKIAVDGSAFGEYFTVVQKGVDRSLGLLVIQLRRTAHYPGAAPGSTTRAAFVPSATMPAVTRPAAPPTTLPAEAPGTLSGGFAVTAPPALTERQQLIRQAVVTGYVRCELFDDEGRWLGFEVVRIKDLEIGEFANIVLPTVARNVQGRSYRVALVVLVP